MERISFEIERQDVVEALHAQAEAHGRSVEAELAALVEETYGPPPRDALRRAPGYPAGMEPLPGESIVDHITRVSRPGFDFDIPPRAVFDLRDPYADAD